MTLPISPPILPMLAAPVAAVPEQGDGDAEWDYEPKWDGFRAIVYRDGDDVRVDSRNARPMQRYFPEVVEAAKAALPDRCVVDGEIVIARPGGTPGAPARLDFEALTLRIHPAASRVVMLAESIPASLVVFDVLALGDDDLTERPLRERLIALDGLHLGGPHVFATPRTASADVAREWFVRFEGAGLDGVVAKRMGERYQPDKRAMRKIKHSRTADVVLAGYRLHKTSTPERPLLGSMLLGLYDEAGGLQFVGVAASFSAVRRAALVEELADLVLTPGADAYAAHPWADWQDFYGTGLGNGREQGSGAGQGRRPGAQSRWSSGKDLSFVALRTERVLEVGYDHMEGTRFRHTTQFKRWRPDREPESCAFAQLEEPVRYDLASLLPGAPGTT
jgi:ATP-dependent DNA ligase